MTNQILLLVKKIAIARSCHQCGHEVAIKTQTQKKTGLHVIYRCEACKTELKELRDLRT